MELLTNYYYAEMLCNLISQTMAVLKRVHATQASIAPHLGILGLNTIHFGASRGSGHSTTIEALTNIYTSEIICSNNRQKSYYDGRAAGTKVESWAEALRDLGRPVRDLEVVFIDNWLDILKKDGESFWKNFEKISERYDRTFTVFALIH